MVQVLFLKLLILKLRGKVVNDDMHVVRCVYVSGCTVMCLVNLHIRWSLHPNMNNMCGHLKQKKKTIFEANYHLLPFTAPLYSSLVT